MFALDEEQIAIRDMAATFAAERLAPKAIEWDRTKHFPIDVLREAAGLGFGAICVAERHGGAGMNRFDAAVVFEALATGCPTVAAYLSIHNMCAWMVERYGTDAQQTRWLQKLCSMEFLSSYCLTEASAGSDAAALRTRASRDGDGFVLNGTKQFISAAGASDLYIVMARTGAAGAKGISAFLVEKGTRGLSFGADEAKMGWNAQPTRQVILDDCRVPADAMLGPEGSGFAIAMSGLDGGRVNIGACSLGGGEAALAKALAYMKNRRVFGQTLVELQALRFRLADMATELEAARSLLWRAAAALDAKDPEATRLCAMAKQVATDAGFDVANQALQLHGGYGYLCEFGVEKIVRDLRVHQILEGSNEIMRHIVARGMIEDRR